MNALSGLYPMMDEHAQYFADPQVDRLHPNDKGHERMARTLYCQLSALPCTF
jgi:lysophospholipase L1-like esterase